MTARKIKHARMLEHRADFFRTVNEGNLDVLNKVRDKRAEEEKRAKEETKQRKIAKSKELAVKNGKGQPEKAKHKPAPKGAFSKIKKDESIVLTRNEEN